MLKGFTLISKAKKLDSFEDAIRKKIISQPNLNIFKTAASVDNVGGLKTSNFIFLIIVKKEKSYKFGEEIKIPAIKSVIENIKQKVSQTVRRYI